MRSGVPCCLSGWLACQCHGKQRAGGAMAINISRSTEAVSDSGLTRCQMFKDATACAYLVHLPLSIQVPCSCSYPVLGILRASTPALLEGDVMLGTGVASSGWTVGVAVPGMVWYSRFGLGLICLHQCLHLYPPSYVSSLVPRSLPVRHKGSRRTINFRFGERKRTLLSILTCPCQPSRILRSKVQLADQELQPPPHF